MSEVKESPIDKLIDCIGQITGVVAKQGEMIRALHERLLILEEGETK